MAQTESEIEFVYLQDTPFPLSFSIKNPPEGAKFIVVFDCSVKSISRVNNWFDDSVHTNAYRWEDGVFTPMTADYLIGVVNHLVSRLTLRHVASGMSTIQERMLELSKMGLKKNEIIGACASNFVFVPKKTIKEQHFELTRGNAPALTHTINDILPHALINGPYPVSPQIVADAIKNKINHPKWKFELPPPSCEKYSFSKSGLSWMSNGTTSRPPYGCSMELQKSSDGEEFSRFVAWDPVFEEGTYEPDAYLVAWLETCLDRFVEKRMMLVEEQEKLELKRRLVRTVCTSQRENVMGMDKLLFLDEDLRAKKSRIMNEYEGRLELLNTPISDFHMGIIFEDDVRIPESARDMILDELKKRKYIT